MEVDGAVGPLDLRSMLGSCLVQNRINEREMVKSGVGIVGF